MSKRLQVPLDDREYREIRKAAAARGQTVAEWVRQALRQARRGGADARVDERIAAIRAAARHRFPAGSVDEMNRDIARGYAAGLPE
jgi:hypothetical protein